ncbi:MAG TPA: phytase [Acidimicrobiia bacterium]
MSATRSQSTPASTRRVIGAALGLVLMVGAAPFLRSASAAQPTTDATAAAETAPVGAGGTANDTAIWVNPQDATKAFVLGANGADGVGVYDLVGAEIDQAGLTTANVTGVDTRNDFMLGGSATSLVTAVGDGGANGMMHFYAIDAAGKLAKKNDITLGPAPAPIDWGQGDISSVCMYHSPVSGNMYAFVMSANGEIAQMQLTDDAGKVKAQIVRGYHSTMAPPAPAWDINAAEPTTVGACVVDDEMQALYVSEKEKGIWKFGAEPGDPMTGTLIDTATNGTPAGHLTNRTLGLAVAKTGEGTGYLIASSIASVGTDAAANQFMVYDRATYAFVRAFRVAAGAIDQCERTDGIDAAVGNFGGSFTAGLFVCMDNKNTNSGAPNALQNYKLVPLEQVADLAPPVTTTTTVPQVTPTTAPGNTTPNRSGYWMVGTEGRVYNFGDAKSYGDATLAAGAQAVDVEPTPSGNGYWIVDDQGHVFAKGDAKAFGDVSRSILSPAEVITSLSATKSGNGYWVFTSLGRAIPFGDAVFYGDMRDTKLNGPVLDSIPTASGKGYYMVGSDGGIFSFGDAVFMGSMGGKPLNKPVQSLVPDGDGSGYWLVASDGGIFAFEAPFKGSMGAIKLNKPVTGMVRYGDGYLMVGEDGGIFSFSTKKFVGSLGDNPPAKPITSVAVLDAPVAP